MTGGVEFNPDPKPRIELARSNPHWREIDDDLEARPPDLLVSASTGLVYRRWRRPVFSDRSIEPEERDRGLTYVVRRVVHMLDELDCIVYDDVVLLEPLGQTWTDLVRPGTHHPRRHLR